MSVQQVILTTIAQLAFVSTGLLLILLAQLLTDCGVNSPWVGFAALAKGVGLLICVVLWILIDCAISGLCSKDRTPRAQLIFRRLRSKRVWSTLTRTALPAALADLGDTIFATAALLWTESGLFIVLFSSLTVWVALLHKIFLRKKKVWTKWLSVVVITFAISATGIESLLVSQSQTNFDALLLLGIVFAVVAAFCDALMYVSIEKAISMEDKAVGDPASKLDSLVQNTDEGNDGGSETEVQKLADEPADRNSFDSSGFNTTLLHSETDKSLDLVEVSLFMGLFSLMASILWVAVVLISSSWNKLVKPVGDCGFNASKQTAAASQLAKLWMLRGTTLDLSVDTLLWLWTLQGIVGFGVHYIAFFYVIQHANSVVAGISKACQSALIFSLSSFFFCQRSQSQCLTATKVAAALIVFVSTILYSLPFTGKRCPKC